MVRHAKWLSVLAMLAMTSPVFAQPGEGRGPGGDRGGPRGERGGFGGGMRDGGQSKYGLLANPAVQEELAVSADQKAKAADLLREYREAARAAAPAGGGFEGLRDLPQEERREKMTQLMAEATASREKLNNEFAPKFAGVLEEIQLQRLQQIYWQSQGLGALRDPELAKDLNLTEAQHEKLRQGNRGPGGPRGFGGPGGPRGEGGPRRGGEGRPEGGPPSAESFAAQREAQIKELLTPEQFTKFNELRGETFDLSKLRGPGGPGGEGGPRGGGRGDRPNRGGQSL